MKSVFIPGRGSSGYGVLREQLEQSPHEFNTLEVDSERLDTLIESTRAILSQKDPCDIELILGHSWGAVAALLSASLIEPEYTILASLSPEFEEDIQTFGLLRRKLIRGLDFVHSVRGEGLDRHPSFQDVETQRIGKVFLVYGEKEYSGYLGLRPLGYGEILSESRRDFLPVQRELIVGGSGHRVDSSYASEIGRILELLET